LSAVRVEGIDGMRALIGEEIGPTDWRTISQADIDAFAEISGDHQWIHVVPERARAESPYGSTIAHGNLTLSAVDGFRPQLIETSGCDEKPCFVGESVARMQVG
jgi:acyl dehydratase